MSRNLKLRHNPLSRTNKIVIAAGASAVVIATTYLVIRRRRHDVGSSGSAGGLVGTGTPGGSSGSSGSGTTWYQRNAHVVNRLCKAPGSMTEADRSLLIDDVFLPAWVVAGRLLPASPTVQQIDMMTQQIAANVLQQACKSPGLATREAARGLSHAAFLKSQGLSGQ